MTAHDPAAQFFRHEYGRVVAVLSRRVGIQHVESVEDAVQCALMKAVETWTTNGTPDNPSAWIFQVARNQLISELRAQGRRRLRVDPSLLDSLYIPDEGPVCGLESDIQDDQLRMLFVCCDEDIPADSQLVFALKTLCGFSVREIAVRLFTSEANVYKRLARARRKLRGKNNRCTVLNDDTSGKDYSAVNRVLHVMFSEGHLSSDEDLAIRRELCDEAIRLTTLLANHAVGGCPETFALLALMHFHRARMNAREDRSGGLLLLEEQDRTRWDRAGIGNGLHWLARSASGARFTRYHAEAGIAAEHCLADTFEATRWDKVVELYVLLETVAPSPVHTLNHAVALAEWRGPHAGLQALCGIEPPTWLVGSYLWSAVLADLHRRCNHESDAKRYREQALASAPTSAIRKLLARRLNPVTKREQASRAV